MENNSWWKRTLDGRRSYVKDNHIWKSKLEWRLPLMKDDPYLNAICLYAIKQRTEKQAKKYMLKNKFLFIPSIVRYRAFQKKVPTLVLLISWLPKHLENWFCTFFNSPVFAEFKILGLKLEKLLTKMLWEYYIWNDEYWGFNQFDDKLLFLHFFGFQDTLKRSFILFSTAQYDLYFDIRISEGHTKSAHWYHFR